MIKEYRKKPLIIEAIQWNGNSNKSEIDAFVGKILKTELESETAYLVEKGPPIFSLLLETKEGIMKVSKGDWIIKEPFPTGDRDFYPCKPDIFESTYEEVKDISLKKMKKRNSITEEEIDKAAKEFCEERRLNSRGYPPKEWFKAGVEFACKSQLQKENWTLISEKLPPIGQEVLFQNDKWINMDYNPKGIRIGFLDGTENYYSAYWCSIHDEYHTRNSAEDDSNYKLKKGIDQIPTKWKEIN